MSECVVTSQSCLTCTSATCLEMNGPVSHVLRPIVQSSSVRQQHCALYLACLPVLTTP